MRILCIGDICGRTGRRALKAALPGLKQRLGVDFCTGNVENAAGIFGITEKVIEEIASSGVDVMTGGNHIWDKREAIALLDSRNDVLRPANYPSDVPGKGLFIGAVGHSSIAVLSLQGRTFMPAIDCPFRSADAVLAKLPVEARIVIVDFHAEATSEKQAMGRYLDGRVSVVFGTHTHVQTSDERILPGGTAFITDAGMVGAEDSIIGVKKEQVIERFLKRTPVRFEVATGASTIEALLAEVDEESGRAIAVLRIRERVALSEEEE